MNDGVAIPLERIRETVEMWLRTCPKGDYSLKLEKSTIKRSISQNALLWVWMEVCSKEWAEATDVHYTKEQFKEYFCRKFLPVTDMEGNTIGGSTSTLSSEEMAAFLTKIQVFALQEWDITLLGAEDNMFNEWKRQYE